VACGNSADGTGACRSIEEARCRRAPACGIALEPPFHTSGGDVDACIRYYDVACSHGLTVGEPGAGAVNACVHAIETEPSCTIVHAPETDPNCAWLAAAVSTTADASSADVASSADASSGDGSDDATTD
jgi:hypothetical protein